MNVSDLSPDALARLEEKLVADLEMVRRVRALLEEHRAHFQGAAPAASPSAAPPAALPFGVQVRPEPAVKSKPFDELAEAALAQLPKGGFRVDDLRRKLTRQGNTPSDKSLKNFIHRMIRQGKVAVAQSKTGRGGSLYTHTLPPPAAVETPSATAETPPAPLASPAVSAEN